MDNARGVQGLYRGIHSLGCYHGESNGRKVDKWTDVCRGAVQGACHVEV